jgi:hypothetical protein
LKEFKRAKLGDAWSIEYNKGLGSLSIDEYDLMINNPVAEVIQFDSEAQKSLEIAFGKDSSPRKEWLLK